MQQWIHNQEVREPAMGFDQQERRSMNQTARWGGRMLLAAVAWPTLMAHAAMAQDATLVQADDPYFKQGQETLQRLLALQPNTNEAKNVILFVADGMSVATVTAGRIFEGQQRGVDGESNQLSFEKFPYAAFSKTYAHDAQVADSAPTAVAMVTGIKTRNDIIGLNSSVAVDDCQASQGAHVTTLLEMAEAAGMSTGAVTTARLTHATPAATYAHIPNRDWEADSDVPEEARAKCPDIARQLVELPFGDGMEVAMGGGRDRFLPETAADPEDEGQKGKRADGRDLTQEWLQRYGNSGAYVWNMEEFKALNPAEVDHVLGLFERSHMEYEADREKDAAGEPSLAEMTDKAIDILAKNPEGYFLMVEGGRVDHAHHATNARRALVDMVAFADAVQTAVDKVDLDETLIVVTADHSHTLTIAGYPKRGNPILDVVRDVDGELILGTDGKPYTTLSYANGPGGWSATPADATEDNVEADASAAGMTDGSRPDPSKVDTTDVDYIQQATVPLESETHGGDDVPIFAIGPWAHLFQGVVEQQYIFHVMDRASKISERATSN
jgi:alkaline phosphatase